MAERTRSAASSEKTGYFMIVADGLKPGAAERMVGQGKALVGIEVNEMQNFDAGHSQRTRDASADTARANPDGHAVFPEGRLENASTASSSRIATRATLACLTLAMRRRLSSAAASATTRRPVPCG